MLLSGSDKGIYQYPPNQVKMSRHLNCRPETLFNSFWQVFRQSDEPAVEGVRATRRIHPRLSVTKGNSLIRHPEDLFNFFALLSL
jgi:hypothetical protein